MATSGSALPAPQRRHNVLLAERGAHHRDSLGPLLHAPAFWLVPRRQSVEHPALLVRAYNHRHAVVGAAAALRPLLADAGRLGVAIDAELAPAKCVAWSPAGGRRSPGGRRPG